MKANQSETQTQNEPSDFITDVRVFKSKDGESLVHKFRNNETIELHQNLYKSILDIPFEAKKPSEEPKERSKFYGYRASVDIKLTKDRNWLIHFFPSGKISKHVNFYKTVLLEEGSNEKEGAAR